MISQNPLRLCLVGVFLLFGVLFAQAQTTINTTIGSTGYTGTTSSGNNSFTTFLVENNSGSPIFITEIGSYSTTSHNGTTSTLWYSPTSLSGSPGTLGAPDWTVVTTATVSGITTTGVNTLLSGFQFLIPANTSYRFAHYTTGTNSYSSSGSPNSFTASGVTLRVGDYQINNAYVGYGGSNSPRYFTGSITFVPAGPCVNPPYVGAAISSKSITCSGESFALGLDTLTFGSGQTFQWQSSPNGTTWTNISGATNLNYTATQTTTTSYRVAVTCSATVYSSAVTVSTTSVALPGGTYTINSALPTSGSNFTSFSDFKQAIVCGGITGPLIVNVSPNSSGYNEQILMANISGSSATNTITINGNGAVLKSGGSSSDRGTLTLDGSKYITIKNLIIEGTATANSYGVELRGNAQYITFDSCTVRANATATASSTGAIILSTSATSATTAGLAASHLTVTNSIIEGGYYCFVLNGPTSAPWSANNVIENNEIRDYYLYGLYVRGQENSIIKNNNIHRTNATSISTFYGLYVTSGVEGTQFVGNRIHNSNDNGNASTTNYVMYITGANGSVTNPATFANNAIYNINNTGTLYGVYLTSGTYLNFYHNTINLNDAGMASTGTVRALYFSTSSGVFNVKNNIVNLDIQGSGSKYLLYINSTLPTYTFDYNQYSFKSTGGTNVFGYYGGNVTDFIAWQAVNSGAFDQNSVYGDPIYGLNMITPQTSVGNAAGTNLLSVVPTDIFGAARTATPDIGAVEYTPLTCLQPVNVVGVPSNTAMAFSWTNDPGADSIYIEYGPTGFNQGTGKDTTLLGSSGSVTGLTDATCYDFYITTWCNGVLGNGTALVTYCTKCNPTPMPYLEDFSTWLPMCFSLATTSTWDWQHNATGVAFANFWGSSTGEATMKPREVNITVAAEVRIKWAHLYNTSYPNDAFVVRSQKVGTTVWDTLISFSGPTFNSPNTTSTVPPAASDYIQTIAPLPNSYIGGVAKFEIIGITGYGPNLFVDDFEVGSQPQCAPPISVNATALTSSGAAINWSSAYGTCFKLEYGPTGFTHSTGQGTVVQNATSPQTISGLSPNTYYDVYLFDCCDTLAPSVVYTFKTNCLVQLSGTYTVGGTAGPTNFAKLSDAVLALECGVTGPVTFNIAARTDTLSIEIEAVQGVTATNTITFNGAGKALTTIRIPSGVLSGVTLDGASHITFKNLTIDGASTNKVVWLTNNAQFITFDNCNLWNNPGATSSLMAVVAASGTEASVTAAGNNANNIVIKNCELRGGYYGVSLYGTSTTVPSSNFRIENCTFDQTYYYAVQAYYIENIEILNNTAVTFRATGGYGFYGFYIDNFKINANNFNAKTYAIYLSQGNTMSTSSVKSEVINNMLIGNSYAAYFATVNNYKMYHNSIVANTYGGYLSSNASVDIRNNIFVGGSYPLYATPAITGAVVDYNIYHGTGANVAYWGAGYTTLAAWKTADPTLNGNSLVGDPVFISATDLHVLGTLPNDVGLNGLATVDIDGDVRPATGATNVDIGADEYTPSQKDIAVLSIISPLNQSCGDSNTVIQATFANHGSSSLSNFGFTTVLTGAATQTLTATYTGTLASQGIDTISFPALNTAAGGTYNITVYTTLTGDQNSSNDTVSKTVILNDILVRTPVAYRDTVCAGQYDTLFYPANAGNQSFVWITTNGDTLGDKDGLVVGPMGANDTTFVMSAQANGFSLGPLDNNIGSSSFYTTMNHFLLFTVNSATTIVSVDAFSASAGLIDVIIEDVATNTVLFTHTIAVSTAGKQTLVINQTLSPGNYRMGSSPTNNGGGLARTSTGASYPYTAPDNSVVITGNTFDPLYYYYFYNWQVGSAGCPRPDGSITIYNGGGVTGTFTTTLQPPTATDLTVNFDASGVVGSSAYTWYYGDGATGTGVTSTHAYTINGTYTAILEVNSACGVDSITQQVVIAGIGIEESLLAQSLNLFPNPTHGQFRVSFMLEGVQNTSLRILNTLGQVVYENAIGNISGRYNQDIDMSRQASGVYVLQVITNDGIVNRRITIQK